MLAERYDPLSDKTHGRVVCTVGCHSERHKYKIGQLVNYLSRERASGIYQITQLLPPEGEAFQYRIKAVNEPHERIAKEYELRSAWPSAPELRHVFIRL
jgi:hypothetical protein